MSRKWPSLRRRAASGERRTGADDDVLPWIEACQQHTEANDFEAAERSLLDGLALHPDSLALQEAHAWLPGRAADWPEAVRRLRELYAARSADFVPGSWARLTVACRRVQDLDGAQHFIEQGLERFPSNQRLLKEAGETAMAREDWVAAAAFWARYWRRQGGKAGEPVPLPTHSRTADWFEPAWEQVADHLDAAAARLAEQEVAPPGPGFHLALAQVLRSSGLHEAEQRVLARGRREFPDNAAIEFDESMARLASDPDATGLVVGPAEIARITAALPPYEPSGEGLGPIRLLRVPRRSSLEIALRTGFFIDHDRALERVRELARRDAWPEPVSDRDELLLEAQRLAGEFAAANAAEPHLPAATLADAVTVPVQHELALALPMQRLAVELAAEAAGRPLVLQLQRPGATYLAGYDDGDFGLIYLYFALLQQGANAFLAVLERPSEVLAADAFEVEPGWRAAQPEMRIVEDPAPTPVAIVPAGIRRVRHLVEDLATGAPGRLSIFESGSIVQDFAYDRSIGRRPPMDGTARLFPREELRPTFTFPLVEQGRIAGVALGGPERAVEARVLTSEPLGGSWHDWLARATLPLLDHVARAAAAEVAERDVREVHIADHLYAESAIVGDAVKRAGGRVVLWPHSANPVHVPARRPDAFDEVHAVTRRGAEMWQEAFPDKEVRHSPARMIDRTGAAPYTPGAPLSLVLFGGTSMLGAMPTLDIAAHELLYRDLFAGLAELQAQVPIDVWFKPRSRTGDHDLWLHGVVGSTAHWRPIHVHPTRIDLPNLVFASVSLGTSALLEGLGRGVPGFVVREAPVRDYTTLEKESFPILTASEALSTLRLAHDGGYDALVARQLEAVRRELAL